MKGSNAVDEFPISTGIIIYAMHTAYEISAVSLHVTVFHLVYCIFHFGTEL